MSPKKIPSGTPPSPGTFAHSALMARRLAERGVRFALVENDHRTRQATRSIKQFLARKPVLAAK